MEYIILYLFICVVIYVLMDVGYSDGAVQSLPGLHNRRLYYLIQFTWGLPMNLLGLCVAGVLLLRGQRPVRYGYGWCFEREGDWGLELGIFFIAPPDSTRTKNHELGHGIQNMYFGPFTIFVVSIPSFLRFWWRKIMTKLGAAPCTSYDSVWFEGQATKTGTRFMNEYEKEE